MDCGTWIIVTSIAAPNEPLRELARGSRERGWDFLVVGDRKSPADFALAGCRYLGIGEQRESGLEFARMCPENHYARKNVGYLWAIREGARLIVETDDDNHPRAGFWRVRQRRVEAAALTHGGWVNVYRYFTGEKIWPRGFPLECLDREAPVRGELPVREMDCPMQQGLADRNPDVDAVYRLTQPLPRSFQDAGAVALGEGSWCPFNSQNTAWFPEAFPLLYLPSYCSFRMTDIWRSFAAQRIGWVNGWAVLFERPTVVQERNEHDLLRDFADEIPGYLNNRRIGAELERVELEPGVEAIGENLRRCYARLAELELVGEREPALLEAWLRDLGRLG